MLTLIVVILVPNCYYVRLCSCDLPFRDDVMFTYECDDGLNRSWKDQCSLFSVFLHSIHTIQGRSQDLLEGGSHAPPSSSLSVACLFHAEEIILQRA